jgi:hypothetical protein
VRIYFAGSIRGGRVWNLYQEIIRVLGEYGDVVTEHTSKQKTTVQWWPNW